MLTAVHADEIHIKEGSECLFNKVALIFSHETLIDKNAGELLADRTAEESGGNRAVNAAGKTENNLFVADLFTELFNRRVNEAVHFPVARTAADIENKVSEYLIAVF